MNKKLIIAHGDFDGIASAVGIAKQLGISAEQVRVIFTQPFLVDKVIIPDDIEEIYVVDIAVNNRDAEMTQKFIWSIQNKLFKWYDHHQGWPDQMTRESRDVFKISCKESCAELIEGDNQLLVADAKAADTRRGKLSWQGLLIEQATKANITDDSTRVVAVKWLLGDESQKAVLEKAAEKYSAIQIETKKLVRLYRITGKVAVVDTRDSIYGSFDMTQLLLDGQVKAAFAVAIFADPKKKEDRVVVATQSGKNLVDLFGLPSGAPFRVDLEVARLSEVMEKLNRE